MLYYKQKQTSWNSATCWQDYALNWTIFSFLYSIFGNDDRDVYVVVEDEAETQLNVNVTGSGPRTVVLHVPKDIK